MYGFFCVTSGVGRVFFLGCDGDYRVQNTAQSCCFMQAESVRCPRLWRASVPKQAKRRRSGRPGVIRYGQPSAHLGRIFKRSAFGILLQVSTRPSRSLPVTCARLPSGCRRGRGCRWGLGVGSRD